MAHENEITDLTLQKLRPVIAGSLKDTAAVEKAAAEHSRTLDAVYEWALAKWKEKHPSEIILW